MSPEKKKKKNVRDKKEPMLGPCKVLRKDKRHYVQITDKTLS
jgi:hypothetical protein